MANSARQAGRKPAFRLGFRQQLARFAKYRSKAEYMRRGAMMNKSARLF
jgi:hypothetical protein